MGAELALVAGFGSVALLLARFLLGLVLAIWAVRCGADFELELKPSSALKFKVTHPPVTAETDAVVSFLRVTQPTLRRGSARLDMAEDVNSANR